MHIRYRLCRKPPQQVNEVANASSDPTVTDIFFTANMRWSGRGGGGERTSGADGRDAAGPPFVRGCKRKQDSSPSVSSESSSEDQTLPPRSYFEEGYTFKVVTICETRKVGGRRSANIV